MLVKTPEVPHDFLVLLELFRERKRQREEGKAKEEDIARGCLSAWAVGNEVKCYYIYKHKAVM